MLARLPPFNECTFDEGNLRALFKERSTFCMTPPAIQIGREQTLPYALHHFLFSCDIKSYVFLRGGPQPNKTPRLGFRKMEIPELSLGPTQLGFNKNSSSSSSSSPVESVESNGTCRKRKFFQDHHLKSSAPSPSLQTSVDLQLKDPLPLDWEQCLDLESGKMYYLNRKTSRKSWDWPTNQASVNLELNISTLSGSSSGSRFNRSSETIEETKNNNCKYDGSRDSSNNNNTVALACRKCHLLVVLSRSSPCCPNCKYLHSI